MQFTREPIIETIITPKEGHKLLVRSSKGGEHEEFSLDSVQLVVIGQSCFYRSLEKPKAFFVPASDYEILEVKESRVALKIPGKEPGGIKIAGGREGALKSKEQAPPKEEAAEDREKPSIPTPLPETAERHEKKRKRFKKRASEEPAAAPEPQKPKEERAFIEPPSTLISESISRYRDLPDFKGAFFEKATEEEIKVEEVKPKIEEEEENPIEAIAEEGRDFLNS